MEVCKELAKREAVQSIDTWGSKYLLVDDLLFLSQRTRQYSAYGMLASVRTLNHEAQGG